MAKDANSKHQWLYTVGFSNSLIAIYDLDKTGFPQIGQITTGLDGPAGIALDDQGTLYVANYLGRNVTVYSAGQVQPSLTLNGLTLPVGIAVDKNYDVYVANSGSAPSILVYARAQSSAYKTITSPSIKAPDQIFFDANRDAYFSDEYTGVSEIPYGSDQPVSLGLRDLDGTSGIALDPVTGNLFVSNLGGASHVAVYAPGATHPFRTLRNSANADFLNMATLHDREYVMVPNTSSSNITFYRSSRKKPAFVLSTVANENHGALVKLAGIP